MTAAYFRDSIRPDANRKLRSRRLCYSLLVALILWFIPSCPVAMGAAGPRLSVLTPSYPGAKGAGENSRNVTPNELESLLATRRFHSKEELLQLLFMLYQRHEDQNLRLEGDAFRQLAGELSTLFPLAACRSMALAGDRIVLEFDGPQKVAVPHTWWQVSLLVAERLVLRILPEEKADGEGLAKVMGVPEASPESWKQLRLAIEEGYLNLHFSFMLKIFGVTPRDGIGHDLVYLLDEEHKLSRLELMERAVLAGDSFAVRPPLPAEAGTWQAEIDVLHPDFPNERDLAVADGKMSFFGARLELLAGDRVKTPDGRIVDDPQLWQRLNDSLRQFSAYASTGELPGSVDYTRIFSYYFEEQRMGMGMRLQSGVNTEEKH